MTDKPVETPVLAPNPSLLCKLASIAVHADEFLSPDGHEFDVAALRLAVEDPEVKAWIAKMTAIAMAPVRRRTK